MIIQFIVYFSLIPEGLCSDAQVIIVWICILAATILSAVIYSKYLKERTEAFFGKRRVFWTATILESEKDSKTFTQVMLSHSHTHVRFVHPLTDEG